MPTLKGTCVLTMQILYRRPGTPLETRKFLGCGVCDSVSAYRDTCGNSGGTEVENKGPGIRDANSIFSQLDILWRESLSK